jgi:hypothetical protein
MADLWCWTFDVKLHSTRKKDDLLGNAWLAFAATFHHVAGSFAVLLRMHAMPSTMALLCFVVALAISSC